VKLCSLLVINWKGVVYGSGKSSVQFRVFYHLGQQVLYSAMPIQFLMKCLSDAVFATALCHNLLYPNSVTHCFTFLLLCLFTESLLGVETPPFLAVL
jgi:hypothetical protein